MQFAKDSFYMALRSRLAALNSQRVVTIDGAPETAILVAENESVTSAPKFRDCFYVRFGEAKKVGGIGEGASAPMALDVAISYVTKGAADGGADRGRSLGDLDSELMSLCTPRQAVKCDYTQTPAVDLGTCVFWSAPLLGEPEANGAELTRGAKLTVYFYPEEAA